VGDGVVVFWDRNAVPEASDQNADDACRSYSVFANLSYISISIDWGRGTIVRRELSLYPKIIRMEEESNLLFSEYLPEIELEDDVQPRQSRTIGCPVFVPNRGKRKCSCGSLYALKTDGESS
jgi:hypothetical protein